MRPALGPDERQRGRGDSRMIELGIKFTLAYLLGSVLGSLVVGWFYGGVDIRKLGSGNAGGTNALRTQGKWFALWVMIIDIGKGILAAALIPGLALPGVGIDPEIERSLVLYTVAFAAIAGHVFPVWFQFRGGKGGATAAGLIVYFVPTLALPVLGAWILVVLLTGFVGLATISASLAAVASGRLHAPARAERAVRVRMRLGGAVDLCAPRQHPSHAERYRVALRALGRRPAARRKVTAREPGRTAARVGRRSTRTPEKSFARSFGVTRAAVWKSIAKLADWGLEVSAVPGVGYRLARPIDLLDAQALRAALAPRTAERIARLDVYAELDSTNHHLMSLPAPPAGELAVCIAEFQHAGRGRRGRRWIAPLGGGLCLSVGWQFADTPPELSALTLAVGVVARRALAAVAGVDVGLKWPNDLVLDARKLGGILLELTAEAQGGCYVVAGIGINVSLPPESLRTLSDWPRGAIDLATATSGAPPAARRARGELDRRPRRSCSPGTPRRGSRRIARTGTRPTT